MPVSIDRKIGACGEIGVEVPVTFWSNFCAIDGNESVATRGGKTTQSSVVSCLHSQIHDATNRTAEKYLQIEEAGFGERHKVETDAATDIAS